MPKIPLSQRVSARGASARARTPSMSLMSAPGAAVAQLGSHLLKKAENAKTVIKEKADNSFIHGKVADAVEAFNIIDKDMKQEYGAESYEYPSKFGDLTSNYIQGVISDAPNNKTRANLETQLRRLQLGKSKNAWGDQVIAFKNVNTGRLDRDLDAGRTLIRDDWTNWKGYSINGITSLANAKDSFLSTDEYEEKLFNFRQGIAEDVITGWFRDQPDDQLELSNKIRLGEVDFGDDDINMLFGGLLSDNRERLSNKLRKEHMSTIRAENDSFDNDDKKRKTNFNRDLLRFFSFDDDAGSEEKQAIFDNLQYHEEMDVNTLVKMQDVLAGRDFQSDAEAIATANLNISTGVITTQKELFDLVGNGLSYEDVQELSPKVTAFQDKRFKKAEQSLKTKFGVPPGFVIDETTFVQAEKDAFEELVDFSISNPGGDFTKKVNELHKDSQDKIKAQKIEKLQKSKEQLEFLMSLDKKDRGAKKSIATLQLRIKNLEKKINE